MRLENYTKGTLHLIRARSGISSRRTYKAFLCIVHSFRNSLRLMQTSNAPRKLHQRNPASHSCALSFFINLFKEVATGSAVQGGKCHDGCHNSPYTGRCGGPCTSFYGIWYRVISPLGENSSDKASPRGEVASVRQIASGEGIRRVFQKSCSPTRYRAGRCRISWGTPMNCPEGWLVTVLLLLKVPGSIPGPGGQEIFLKGVLVWREWWTLPWCVWVLSGLFRLLPRLHSAVSVSPPPSRLTPIHSTSWHERQVGQTAPISLCLLSSSHLGVLGSISGGVALRFSYVGIVPGDASGQRAFSGISSFLPPLHSGAAPYSIHFALICSQMSPRRSPLISSLRVCLPQVLAYLQLLPAFETEKRGSCKGHTRTCIKCAIAAKRKALDWCALFPSSTSGRGDNSPPAKRVRIPTGSLPDFRSCESLPDDAAGYVLPCPCIPALLHTHVASPSSALKTSMLKRLPHLDTQPSFQANCLFNKATRLQKQSVMTENGVKSVNTKYGKSPYSLWLRVTRTNNADSTRSFPRHCNKEMIVSAAVNVIHVNIAMVFKYFDRTRDVDHTKITWSKDGKPLDVHSRLERDLRPTLREHQESLILTSLTPENDTDVEFSLCQCCSSLVREVGKVGSSGRDMCSEHGFAPALWRQMVSPVPRRCRELDITHTHIGVDFFELGRRCEVGKPACFNIRRASVIRRVSAMFKNKQPVSRLVCVCVLSEYSDCDAPKSCTGVGNGVSYLDGFQASKQSPPPPHNNFVMYTRDVARFAVEFRDQIVKVRRAAVEQCREMGEKNEGKGTISRLGSEGENIFCCSKNCGKKLLELKVWYKDFKIIQCSPARKEAAVRRSYRTGSRDESKFNIYSSDGRMLVWCKPNIEFEQKNLQATVRHGGGGGRDLGALVGLRSGGTGFHRREYGQTRMLSKDRITSKPQLEELGLLQKEWNDIGWNITRNLVHSVSKGHKAITSGKGSSTLATECSRDMRRRRPVVGWRRGVCVRQGAPPERQQAVSSPGIGLEMRPASVGVRHPPLEGGESQSGHRFLSSPPLPPNLVRTAYLSCAVSEYRCGSGWDMAVTRRHMASQYRSAPGDARRRLSPPLLPFNISPPPLFYSTLLLLSSSFSRLQQVCGARGSALPTLTAWPRPQHLLKHGRASNRRLRPCPISEYFIHIVATDRELPLCARSGSGGGGGDPHPPSASPADALAASSLSPPSRPAGERMAAARSSWRRSPSSSLLLEPTNVEEAQEHSATAGLRVVLVEALELSEGTGTSARRTDDGRLRGDGGRGVCGVNGRVGSVLRSQIPCRQPASGVPGGVKAVLQVVRLRGGVFLRVRPPAEKAELMRSWTLLGVARAAFCSALTAGGVLVVSTGRSEIKTLSAMLGYVRKRTRKRERNKRDSVALITPTREKAPDRRAP
ncbi:hypothetical protein PR048_028710 [Dryococelus australis]|uniref:Uncharacterized protein n=1 Tax=Dryococelus australis TaxID=614101 RepID=A0ABQ9GBC1_9NEOP|nr:hypothetical protein PR048_028710 [Dryococelus australis]